MIYNIEEIEDYNIPNFRDFSPLISKWFDRRLPSIDDMDNFFDEGYSRTFILRDEYEDIVAFCKVKDPMLIEDYWQLERESISMVVNDNRYNLIDKLISIRKGCGRILLRVVEDILEEENGYGFVLISDACSGERLVRYYEDNGYSKLIDGYSYMIKEIE